MGSIDLCQLEISDLPKQQSDRIGNSIVGFHSSTKSLSVVHHNDFDG
ncbi:hypothetical protein F7734_37690 [Scytonema sp. UIC 10036]|nr:hypothetical protein [Scytonema sp. UIC 10036]MUG97739.1 hypothetical protein [Scytonema sp. UIC 10036]